jgi:hypothetical protein
VPHHGFHFLVAKNGRQKTTAGQKFARYVSFFWLRYESVNIPRFLKVNGSGSSLLISTKKTAVLWYFHLYAEGYKVTLSLQPLHPLKN